MISKKRKRIIVPGTEAEDVPRQKAQKLVAKQNAAQIAELEAGIGASQKNLNNIATLLSLAKKDIKLGHAQSAASIALCRVFCRLQVDGRLTRSSASSEKELTVIEWLRARYTEYQHLLLDRLQSRDSAASLPALSLCMQLVREDVSNAKESSWKIGLFPKIVAAVLADAEGSELCQEFAKTYVQPYDDVRHYMFIVITYVGMLNHLVELYLLLADNFSKVMHGTTHNMPIIELTVFSSCQPSTPSTAPPPQNSPPSSAPPHQPRNHSSPLPTAKPANKPGSL